AQIGEGDAARRRAGAIAVRRVRGPDYFLAPAFRFTVFFFPAAFLAAFLGAFFFAGAAFFFALALAAFFTLRLGAGFLGGASDASPSATTTSSSASAPRSPGADSPISSSSGRSIPLSNSSFMMRHPISRVRWVASLSEAQPRRQADGARVYRFKIVS